MSWRSDSMNSSSGSSGMAMRRQDWISRSPLASGRNAAMVPSGCRYALSPSKTSCA
ncbi:Uncharacterised protein [Mycobacteroides abscessus subsp. abscessus]|nr:Uncharacterised protein [Mycobacteroides abscessus subsp. abscessus]SKU86843.1 Uncharacterised protein [Mycobacteroides abscessus subsp. abscessus]